MTESEIQDGWKAANVARVKMEMARYGLTVADLIDPGDNQPMVNQTQTPILPASVYKVAGE